ncbi:NAD(P)/FAD-dependent oxidoreductase [Oceanibaculum indicum]|uniref:Putative oxidoreductase n=1 Tax=Oceanibaculum indicum P24 TaxID=1207063 RepID=K2JAG0_9PROT|nr:FAD-binding oxidoreductase [Oceanibaculum indicum]EKE72113.1 putative oxidoreductase [Oceanibaculum indicum P24]
MSARPDMPYWWEEAEPAAASTGALPARADVVVVGGGYAGMGAAIPLARAGREVVVLERDRPGDGASSRNGGITSGNIRHSFSSLISKYGLEKAKAIYAEGVAAREELYAFIEAEKLDCDFQPTGRFTGAMRPEILDTMKREMALLHEHIGVEPVIVERLDMQDEIGSDLYHGGVRRADIGGVHPAKLHRALRGVAEAAGAAIHSGVGVTNIRRTGTTFEVTTPKGKIQAAHVIVATNGYTDKGLPWLRRRLVPVISEMIATEPLSPNLMQKLMPKRQMHGETRQLGYYYRPSPDGTRILLGGRRYASDTAEARERLRQGLIEIFPELDKVQLTHHWGGFVAFPMDQLPKLTVQDGIVYAAGFCGSGVVWARWMGMKAAALVLERDEPSAFYSDAFRRIPFYNGKPWFLPVMMNWYKLKDRLTGTMK